ncbi:N-acetyltransferase [Sphingomonas sp. Leaf28]|uniref:N-acetyltransferase n=1 Tax=Sphingomonas sp. Leaf28 TaxID=1735695 RepID=UPI0006FB61AC|nr:acyltransferase [Sphingomonas sp. Leaf28]KQN07407.1 dTDP-6-deoxy-3,4-keto-hexulose isomerase [Sphingomonas sp. Leaf28]
MTVAPVFVHPLADVAATATIGMGTRVWQYAIILAGARIGEDCNVCAHTLVEGNVVIGDRVTVKSGVFLWDGLVIEDDAFLGPNCIFTNDSHPRSRQRKPYPVTRIEKGASIGAGAIVLPGLTIGAGAMIGAGAVVTKSVPAGETWVGNPARHLVART